MKVLFIHHSTGGNLIKEGKVRKLLHDKRPSVEFWDHSYNRFWFLPNFLASLTHHTGLSNMDGNMTGRDFNINLSNNSPREYAEIFSREREDAPLKSILDFDVVIFKNCYPTTKIESDSQLKLYKKFYLKIRSSLGKYKDKKFVLVTPPPLRKETTNSQNAKRAKLLVQWLTSPDFIKQYENISVFDLFGLLTDDYGFLRQEYCRSVLFDSHPNKLANKNVAEEFVKYICKLIDLKA